MKKILLLGTVLVLLLTASGSVFAQETLKDKIADKIEEKVVKIDDKLEKVAQKVLGKGVVMGATVTAKDGATLTVTKDGKTVTVVTDSKTIFRRKYWGKSTLDEISVGDVINVHGKWADDTKTKIIAWLIRDTSIQKRNGVFVGKVTGLSASGWVMETVNRGSLTVAISSSTKLVNRKGETIVQADIKVGDRVRVKGLWDKKLSTLTEATHVKDYNLPVVPSITPSVTPTP